MVIAEAKPVAEILDMIKDFQKVIVAGCKGCVTVCNAGGEKEVAILASELRIARKAAGSDLEVQEYTCERQCDPEYIEPLDDLVADADAIVSIACSVGPQYCAARYPYKPVFPGLNTTSIGGAVEHGSGRNSARPAAPASSATSAASAPSPAAPSSSSTAPAAALPRAFAKWARVPSPASGTSSTTA